MSCKLELELCGYVKDNCTKALKVCDFDCSDGEVGWLNIVLLVLVVLGIYYFFWIYRPRKKKRRSLKLQRDRGTETVIVNAEPVAISSLNQPAVF